FLRECAPASTFSPQALEALQNYSWPGNVRELKNTVVAAGVLAGVPEITLAHLPPEINARARAPLGATPTLLREMEQQMIIETLARTGGSFQRAAVMLGISKRTLSRKLRRYEVEDAQVMAA